MPTYDSDQIAAVTANGGFSLGENEATVKTAVFTSEATAADTVLNVARLPGGSKVLFVAVNAEASTTTTLTFSADGDTIGAALDSSGAIVNVTTGIGAASVAVGQDGLVIGTFNTGVTGTPEVNGTVYYIDGEDN